LRWRATQNSAPKITQNNLPNHILFLTLRIILHNFLLDIWHDGCSGSLIGKGALLPHARRCFRQKRAVEISGNSAENTEGFRGALNEGKGAASS
jgi:hypothetical protein